MTGPAFAGADSAAGSAGATAERVVLLAKNDAGADSGKKGRWIHKAQEGGAETPYKWELGLLSDLYQESVKSKDGSSSGAGHYDLNVKALYVVHHAIEVGGNLEYSESTVKFDSGTSKTSAYLLSLLGVYNFGNLDKDVNVFFLDGGLGLGSLSSKTSGDAGTSTSESRMLLLFGLGLHHFVDSNVALTAEVDLQYGNSKAKGGDSSTVMDLHLLRLGFTLFI